MTDLTSRYRAAALAELREHMTGPLGLADADLDTLVRKVKRLPARPPGRAPYEGIFPAITPAVLTLEQLAALVEPTTAAVWLEPITAALRPAGWPPLVVAHWLAQVLHESASLARLEENLSYTAERIVVVFGHRIPAVDAPRFARNPVALAERVYGGRRDLGNGPEGSGDGWRYRGRGLIQLTGRSNYARMQTLTGLPLVESPDVAMQPPAAARNAVELLSRSGATSAAERDDVAAVTAAINGGHNGLADRARLLAASKRTLGI